MLCKVCQSIKGNILLDGIAEHIWATVRFTDDVNSLIAICISGINKTAKLILPFCIRTVEINQDTII